jgi:hypothetical protein
MDKAIAFRVADVNEGCINTWENIFNNAKVDISDLMVA